MSQIQISKSRYNAIVSQIGLILFPLILTSIGIVAVMIQTGNKSVFFYKELINVSISFVFFLLGGNLYYLLDKKRWLVTLYLLITAVLITLITPAGSVINGVRSWISIGSFSIQPVEYMKVVAIFFITYEIVFSERWKSSVLYRAVITITLMCYMFYVAVVVGDLGSTVVVFAIIAIMYMIALMKRSNIVYMFLLAVFSLVFAIKFHILKKHQIDRILVLVNPEPYKNSVGYNIHQIKIGLGNGGIFGAGNSQQTLTYKNLIPEQHTDFIFSVIGENFGFVGCAFYFVIFFLFIAHMTKILKRVNLLHEKSIVLGFIIWMTVQFILNVGMNLALTPIVGIPLPFISYGGSALSAIWLMIGIIFEMLNNNEFSRQRYGSANYLI